VILPIPVPGASPLSRGICDNVVCLPSTVIGVTRVSLDKETGGLSAARSRLMQVR
jgi:hypothetical protein